MNYAPFGIIIPLFVKWSNSYWRKNMQIYVMSQMKYSCLNAKTPDDCILNDRSAYVMRDAPSSGWPREM